MSKPIFNTDWRHYESLLPSCCNHLLVHLSQSYQGLLIWKLAGRAGPVVGPDRVGSEPGARPARQAGAHQHRHAHQVRLS